MLLIITHKRIFSHLVGFLVIEKRCFPVCHGHRRGNAYLINIAILLDILMSVLMLGMVIARIGTRYRHMNVDNLDSLKD